MFPLPGLLAQHADESAINLSLSRNGMGFYREHYWSVVQGVVSNQSEQAVEPLLLTHSRTRDNVQFSTQMWLPPRSRSRVFVPVMPLGVEEPAANSLDYYGQLALPSPSGEIDLDRDEMPLLLRHDKFYTGVFVDPEGDNVPMAASRALRLHENLERATASLNTRHLPRIPEAWRQIDGIMVSRNDPQLEPAQIESMRQWVLDGGRLWIMLDQVDPQWPVRLLGDDWNITIIERLRLGDLTIEGPNASHHVTFDYPREFVRVLAPDMEITHRINGEPAAMRKQIGRGQVLVTTMNIDAWIEGEEASPVLEELAWFSRPSNTEDQATPTELASFTSHVNQQIGYRIISRGPVLAVLVIFAGALLGAGLLLARRGRLEFSGLLGVVLAVTATSVLMGVGLLHQSDTPRTIATGQLVESVPGQPYARVERLVGLYTPRDAATDASLAVQGQASGILWPIDAAQGGRLLRLVWTDHDQWHYQSFDLRPGAVRSLRGHELVRLDEPLHATARFTTDGLEGQLHAGPFHAFADAVVVTPSGRLIADMAAEGSSFTAAMVDRASEGQFARAVNVTGTLSEQQISRQEVYRQLDAEADLVREPSLMVWAQGQQPNLVIAGDVTQRNESLLIAPIRIERPEPGQVVAVPSAFLTMTPFTADGRRAGTAYSVERAEWIEGLRDDREILMHFALPQAITQMDVQGATLRMYLRAPGRPYEVLRYAQGKTEVVANGQSPTGRLEVAFEGEDAPVLTDGGVVIGVRIGAPSDGSQPPWSIRYMEVDLTGTAR